MNYLFVYILILEGVLYLKEVRGVFLIVEAFVVLIELALSELFLLKHIHFPFYIQLYPSSDPSIYWIEIRESVYSSEP